MVFEAARFVPQGTKPERKAGSGRWGNQTYSGLIVERSWDVPSPASGYCWYLSHSIQYRILQSPALPTRFCRHLFASPNPVHTTKGVRHVRFVLYLSRTDTA